MRKGGSRISYVILGFSMMGIAFCILSSFLLINVESTLVLVVFSLLFTSLTFPLSVSSTRKALLLLMGNIIGLCWNYLFFQLAYTAIYYLGDFFKVLYVIFSPFVNLLWIVSFWSISLTVMSAAEDRGVG